MALLSTQLYAFRFMKVQYTNPSRKDFTLYNFSICFVVVVAIGECIRLQLAILFLGDIPGDFSHSGFFFSIIKGRLGDS